jgi:hypothetical protein
MYIRYEGANPDIHVTEVADVVPAGSDTRAVI